MYVHAHINCTLYNIQGDTRQVEGNESRTDWRGEKNSEISKRWETGTLHNLHWSLYKLCVQQMISEQQRNEAEWDQRRVAEARAGLVLENQLNRQKKLAAKNLVEENKRLAAEQKAKWVI